MSDKIPSEFEKAASEEQHGNMAKEIWSLLKFNKKWWLLPIIVLLMLFALLIFLSGTAIAPFIYTLF